MVDSSRSTVTFCTRLKTQTAPAHRRAESSLFIQELMAGSLNVHAVMTLLAALEPVYQRLERMLRSVGSDPTIALFDHRALDRADRLFADLRSYGRGHTGDLPKATYAYVELITSAAGSPQRLLAHHYTRYLGDLAGGQAISRLVQKHYGIDPEQLTYYDFSAIGDTYHYRKQYRALLDLLPWSPVEQAVFISECETAYDINAALFMEIGQQLRLESPPLVDTFNEVGRRSENLRVPGHARFPG